VKAYAVILALLLPLLAGCANEYWPNRLHDAADIFTLIVGYGGGVKARVGPLHAGLFAGTDYAGLRGGEAGLFPNDAAFPNDGELTLVSAEDFFCPGERDKSFKARGGFLLAGPSYSTTVSPFEWHLHSHPFYYYTEIEAAIGIGGTLRAGFNPGEFVDFLLGFVGIDIFHDDKPGS
jgi:hypothetical protein